MRKVLAIAILSLQTIGCATSILGPTHSPGLVDNWSQRSEPVLTMEAPPIDLGVQVDTTFKGRPVPGWSNAMSQKNYREWFRNQLKYFPILSGADYDLPNAPYRLEVTGMWSLLTSGQETSLELQGVLYRNGTPVRTYKAKGSHRVDMRLIGMPRKYPNRLGLFKRVPTYDGTIRDLLLQIERDASELFQSTSVGS